MLACLVAFVVVSPAWCNVGDDWAPVMHTGVGHDDTASMIQTGVQKGKEAERGTTHRATSESVGHDVIVDWNLGAVDVPRLHLKHQTPDLADLSRQRRVSANVEDDGRPARPPDKNALHGLGRIAQILPVLVVIGLAMQKLRGMFFLPGKVEVKRIAELLTALTLFLVSGPAVIILNKRIMKDHHFHFPILLSSLGQIAMMIVTRTSVMLGMVELQTKSMEWSRYMKVVFLMNAFNFATQVLGMKSYMFVSVPEIQVLKSITIVQVMIFAALFAKEPVTLFVVVAVMVIAAGTCVSAIYENDTSRISSSASAQAIGVLLCVLASTFEAAKSVISQILMDSLKVFDGLYWSSPAFTVLAIIFVAIFELKGLIHHHFTVPLILMLVLNAVLTGLIVFSSFWFVKLVGALTLKVVTQARTVGLILISVFFFHEHCSPMTYIGYAVSLIGIGAFDQAKALQAAEAKKLAGQEAAVLPASSASSPETSPQSKGETQQLRKQKA